MLYKVENGKHTDLPLKGEGRTLWQEGESSAGQWGTLRIVAMGNMFEVYHDGRKL